MKIEIQIVSTRSAHNSHKYPGLRMILLALLVIFSSITKIQAQFGITNYTVLHNFGGVSSDDGYYPGFSSLIPSGPSLPGIGSPLYGTTCSGPFTAAGSGGDDGIIYGMSPNGRNYQIVFDFYDGLDVGECPFASLFNVDGSLFGTTSASNGGEYSPDGTVFKFQPFTNGYSTLHLFTGSFYNDGGVPEGPLCAYGTTLFGTTAFWGTNNGGQGTVFKINTDGSGYQIIHNFIYSTNFEDGFNPYCGVTIDSSGTVYGATSMGGAGSPAGDGGSGAIFKMQPDGSGYTILHSFDDGTYTNVDGRTPYSALTLVGNTLYGTTVWDAGGGGSPPDGFGTVFKVNTDGSAYSVIHYFNSYTNGADGYAPIGPLTYYSNALYGTSSKAGTNGDGVLFKMDLDGSNFTPLHSFAGIPSDGSAPGSPLTLVRNIYGDYLYGTTQLGGITNTGTVFVLPLYTKSPGGAPVFTSPADGSVIPDSTNVTISVDASNATGAVQVSIYANYTLLVTITNGPYTYTWTNPPTGDYTIAVVAADSNGIPISGSAIDMYSEPSVYFTGGTVNTLGLPMSQPNTFSFSVSGTPNITWTVYSCGDIPAWEAIGTIQTDGSGNGSFTDTNSGTSNSFQNFYKLEYGGEDSDIFGYELYGYLTSSGSISPSVMTTNPIASLSPATVDSVLTPSNMFDSSGNPWTPEDALFDDNTDPDDHPWGGSGWDSGDYSYGYGQGLWLYGFDGITIAFIGNLPPGNYGLW